MERWYFGSGKEGKNITLYTQDPQESVLGWINFLKEEAYKLTAKC